MSPLGQRCKHGAMMPTAAQLAYHYAALWRRDLGAAVESCIDWCSTCTGLNRADGGKQT